MKAVERVVKEIKVLKEDNNKSKKEIKYLKEKAELKGKENGKDK